jgi:hypothetical protein
MAAKLPGQVEFFLACAGAIWILVFCANLLYAAVHFLKHVYLKQERAGHVDVIKGQIDALDALEKRVAALEQHIADGMQTYRAAKELDGFLLKAYGNAKRP